MRILILNYEFPPLGGGAANATYYLLKEYAKDKNLEIDLVTSSIDKHKVETFSSNINIHYLDIGKKGNLHYQSNLDLISYSYKAYRYCKKLKKENTYDLIHAFFGVPCGYIAMKLGIPYIVALRGSDVPFYNKRFFWLDKLIFKRLSKKIWRKSKATITNSEGLKELALASAPIQKIGVIHNGVDIDQFQPLESKGTNEKLKIVSTGRLIARKGYQYLIPALKGLNVKLQLIGDGNLMDELKEITTKNGVDVEFLGLKSKDEVVKHLQQADIFVLPSLNEGMSNSVLEAMACGLPIIATDVGGSEELIHDNGFIVSKGCVDSLTKIVSKYSENPELIKIHGEKSRELALSMSWGSMANTYIEVYNELA